MLKSYVYAIGLAAVVLTVGVLYARYFLLLHSAAKTDTIYANIAVNGVAVGGLTREDALKKLAAHFQPAFDQQTIAIRCDGSTVCTYLFRDFNATLDFTALVNAAYAYGRSGGASTRYKALRLLEKQTYAIEGVPAVLYDEKRLQERLEAIRGKVYQAPVNASMSRVNNQFLVKEGTPGKEPDLDAVAKDLRRVLAEQADGTVIVARKTITPTYNAADMVKSQALLGTFTTQYAGSEADPRNINIHIAAGRLNNVLVYPGETFSARAVVGEGTPENGYERATVIVDGQPTDDFGGGICQLTSTLYNAVLFAELSVTERLNHSAKVSYLDYGFDAAIAGDYLDLKFCNDTNYPVLVVSDMRDGALTVAIYGHETRAANRRIAFSAELVETLRPEPAVQQKDDHLPAGQTLVLTEPKDGYRYDLYKTVYENDRAVAKVKINTSVYKPVRGLVAVGP